MPATKDAIVSEFLTSVLRYGYRRAAVEDVARALRISKKTVYEAFPSKQDLYGQALELWATGQRRSLESRLTEKSALGKITQSIVIAFADARRGFEQSRVQDHSEPPEILSQVNDRVFGPMIREVIVQGNASGEFHVADPDITAAFCMAIGTEAVRMLRDDKSGRPEAAAQEAIRRLLLGSPGEGAK